MDKDNMSKEKLEQISWFGKTLHNVDNEIGCRIIWDGSIDICEGDVLWINVHKAPDDPILVVGHDADGSWFACAEFDKFNVSAMRDSDDLPALTQEEVRDMIKEKLMEICKSIEFLIF